MRRVFYGFIGGILFSLLAYLFNLTNPGNTNFFIFIIILQGIVMGWVWHIGATSNYEAGCQEGLKSAEKKEFGI